MSNVQAKLANLLIVSFFFLQNLKADSPDSLETELRYRIEAFASSSNGGAYMPEYREMINDDREIDRILASFVSEHEDYNFAFHALGMLLTRKAYIDEADSAATNYLNSKRNLLEDKSFDWSQTNGLIQNSIIYIGKSAPNDAEEIIAPWLDAPDFFIIASSLKSLANLGTDKAREYVDFFFKHKNNGQFRQEYVDMILNKFKTSEGSKSGIKQAIEETKESATAVKKETPKPEPKAPNPAVEESALKKKESESIAEEPEPTSNYFFVYVLGAIAVIAVLFVVIRKK